MLICSLTVLSMTDKAAKRRLSNRIFKISKKLQAQRTKRARSGSSFRTASERPTREEREREREGERERERERERGRERDRRNNAATIHSRNLSSGWGHRYKKINHSRTSQFTVGPSCHTTPAGEPSSWSVLPLPARKKTSRCKDLRILCTRRREDTRERR